MKPNSSRLETALPLPLAGEGWVGVSPRVTLPVWREPPPALHLSMQCDLPRKSGRGGEPHASLTVSALKSLPSASNTFLTMLLESRPARAYIAAGES